MFWRVCIIAMTMLLAACSFQQTLDNLISPARQAEFVGIAQCLCRDPRSLQHRFDPAAFERSLPIFAQAQGQCPTEADVRWQVAAYNFNTSAGIDREVSRREYVLVVAGDDDGPWTEVQLSFQQSGEAEPSIFEWTAQRMTSRPPSVAFIDGWEASRKWIIAGLLGAVVLVAGIIFWFVRRRKQQGKGLTEA